MSNEPKGLWKRVSEPEFASGMQAVGNWTEAGAAALFHHLSEGADCAFAFDPGHLDSVFAEFTEQGLIDEARHALDRSHFEDDDAYFEGILEAHRDAGIEVLATRAGTYIVDGNL